MASAVTLGSADTLKIVLTTTEGKSSKKPHQAFLTLHEQATGLEESFAFSIKDNGKGKVELVGQGMRCGWIRGPANRWPQTQKDLPFQFLTSSKPVQASILIASFGSSTPMNKDIFNLVVANDAAAPLAIPSPPERHTSKPEIHHIFRDDPKSPPKIISLIFTLAVIVTIPALFGLWAGLGGNLDHAGKAFNASPVAHGLFFGSIVAMEGVFFLYYWSWNLFQTLPVAAVVGVVAYVSGSRALTEVQERRFAGDR